MTDFSDIFKLNTGVFEAPNVVSPIGKKIDKSDPIYIQGLKGEKGEPGSGGSGEIDIPGTGLVKTASGILSLAVAGTDYLTPSGNGSSLTGLTKTQVGLSNVDNTSDLSKPISTATQTALDGKVDENASITGATKTKITYDAKGLITSGADATTADINDSTNRRYVTDSQLVVIGNTSGINTGDQTITLTGDVTGSGTGSFATAIANDSVTLAKMANIATASLIYRKTAGTGDPEVQTIATLKTDLGLTGTNSGDQTSIVGLTGTKAQFDTAVTDGNFLYVGDVTSNATHTGDVTGSTALTIANDAVTYAKMQNVSATDRLLGRSTAGAGDVEEIACTAAGRAILDDADATAQRVTLGLVIGTNVQAYSSILANTTASFLTADETKIDFITITQAVNLDTLESDTATNNAKVTNATHTGEITGATALTLDKTSITNRSTVSIATGDLILYADVSDTNNLKKTTVSDLLSLAGGGVSDGDKGEIVVSSGGTVWNIDTASTPQVQRIGIGQASSATISEAITIGSSTHIGIEILSAASQSGNLINFRDSASVLLSAFNKDGYFFKGTSRFLHWSGNTSFPGAFVGTGAGNLSSTGNNNAGFGSGAMGSIAGGGDNLAIGGDALRDLSSGSSNTAVGAAANYLNTGASGNTAIGRNALASATAGNNIGIGAYAGDNITTGTNNVIIGTSVDAPVISTNGQLSIQNIIFGTGNTATGTTLSTGNIGIGHNDPQARLHIIKTTEQLRVGYDTSNYFNTTVSSAGVVTLNAVGASSSFVFSDDVSVPDEAYDATAWNGSLEVPTKNAIRDKINDLITFYGNTFSPTARSFTTEADIGTDEVTNVVVPTGAKVEIIITGSYSHGTANGEVNFRCRRDSTGLGFWHSAVDYRASTNGSDGYFCVTTVDTPAAGTYTYGLRAFTGSGTGYVKIVQIRIKVINI